jgi:hypothetical protein
LHAVVSGLVLLAIFLLLLTSSWKALKAKRSRLFYWRISAGLLWPGVLCFFIVAINAPATGANGVPIESNSKFIFLGLLFLFLGICSILLRVVLDVIHRWKGRSR